MDERGCCCTASIHFLGRRYFGSLLSIISITIRIDQRYKLDRSVAVNNPLR